MSAASSSIDNLVLSLHAINAICLDGPYTLKSGLQSPFYIDLRVIVSHPDVLRAVSDAMYSLVTSSPSSTFDLICGVPYTALPIATLMSVTHSKPMLMRRKEVKSYGLKKVIEGVYKAGQTCLVVEDLVTSGMSVFETIQPLEECGLKVNDIVVLINREQGGRENIEGQGKRLHAVVTITEVMQILLKHGKIKEETVEKVKEFVKKSQVEIKTEPPTTVSSPIPSVHHRLAYSARIPLCKNATARILLNIIDTKKSNLCLSADVTSTKELLELMEKTGESICMLKTHVDILNDFTPALIPQLVQLAQKYNFLLFEDRKYADIGSTVQQQYSGGVFRTAEWAHVINAHTVAGEGIVKGLKAPIEKILKDANVQSDLNQIKSHRGLLLIAEMSSEGALATGTYTDASVKMAEENQDFVCGFICQHALSKLPGLLHMSPGVQLPADVAAAAPSASSSTSQRTGTDTLGQQYHSPESIIGVRGSDIIIVGRAIVNAKDPAAEARRYQQAGWKAYEESLQQMSK